MGYTHYWELRVDADRDAIALAIDDCRKIVAHYRNILAGPDGYGEPVASESVVAFNGQGEAAHETFLFSTSSLGFSFCKTARKPYDVAVTACLSACADRLKGVLSVHSDGARGDLVEGAAQAELILGRLIANPITE